MNEKNPTTEQSVGDDLRRKRPSLARAADHGRSRAAAIELNCIECCGGSRREATKCVSQSCFLWPFRPGDDHTRDPGTVPTEADYEEFIKERVGKEELERRRLHGQALGRKRKETK